MSEAEWVLSQAQAFIRLFDELQGVRFPDLDANVLRAATEELVARQSIVESAESTLQLERAELLRESEAVLKKTQRAQAYLRVYAESDPALAAKVEALCATLPSAALSAEPPQAPRRRGRPRKNATPELLFAQATEDDSAAAAHQG